MGEWLARGYRNFQNFLIAICFHCGSLYLWPRYPQNSPKSRKGMA